LFSVLNAELAALSSMASLDKFQRFDVTIKKFEVALAKKDLEI